VSHGKGTCARIWPLPQSSQVTGPRFVTTRSTRYGRILRLQVKIVVESAKTLQGLVRSLAKPCSPKRKVSTDLGRAQVRCKGENFGSTPTTKAGMGGCGCVYQAGAHSPASNKLSSPVNCEPVIIELELGGFDRLSNRRHVLIVDHTQ